MNITIAVCTLLAWTAVWIVCVIAAPWVLSDENKFFAGFVNQEFLSFMGVIVTITLASAANLFIELNKLEDKIEAPIFNKTKSGIRHSAYSLVSALIASIILVIVKPLIAVNHRWEAGVNGIAVTILIFSILILIDLTQAAFGLDPRAK